MWDWKSWLSSHINGLEGHSVPHVFHFYRDANMNSVLRNKPYHTEGEWSEPIKLLRSIPQGTPSFVPLQPTPIILTTLFDVINRSTLQDQTLAFAH